MIRFIYFFSLGWSFGDPLVGLDPCGFFPTWIFCDSMKFPILSTQKKATVRVKPVLVNEGMQSILTV